MKVFYLLLTFVFFLTFTSCENNSKTSTQDTKQTSSSVVDLQKIAVNIEGMTCEIGCAKLIQSKIYKLEGVTESKVEFEKNIGKFTFDKNKISSEEIVKNINGIAGGDLYKVTDIKTVQ